MIDLKIYNSFTKHLEPFEPLEPGKVRVYHCGPTVYKRQHIGNMRRYLFADILRRSLEYFGYEVREIINITDVGHLTQDDIDEGEDKIAKEAKRRQISPQEIAEEQIALFEEDLRALHIQRSHMYPRATHHVEQMQTLIAKLLENGFAYQAESGIYFDVTKFADYGQLSGNTLAQLEAGKRIEVRGEKKHPADFALWIFDTKQLQRWDSPWGEGYPGWHIECSAMSLEYLGPNIDIHTGGEDNKFPHHENEIAQSEAVIGQKFVRYWMHNSHLRLQGQKLAKREGEQITLDTIQDQGFSPLAFRLMVFANHYRNHMEFSWETLGEFAEHLKSLKHLLRRLYEHEITYAVAYDEAAVLPFTTALADDLNTPKAWAAFLDYTKVANMRLSADTMNPHQASEIVNTLLRMDEVLGVLQPLILDIERETIPEDVLELVEEREQARLNKDFQGADDLRVRVESMGYVIEDTPGGPRVIKG